MDITITQADARRTVARPHLPTLPTRMLLLQAQQTASGVRVVPDPQSEDGYRVDHDPDLADGGDLLAIGYAVLGLTLWGHRKYTGDLGPAEGFPDWRALGRDPVVYGEEVQTWLWDRGWREDATEEWMTAAREILGWIQRETLDLEEAVEEAAEDFSAARD